MTQPDPLARNRLQEYLQQRGLPIDLLRVRTERVGAQDFVSTVTLDLPGGRPIHATSPPTRGKKPAERTACAAVLAALTQATELPDLDWEALRLEAQAGDALVKLAAYRSRRHTTAAAASGWLQRRERDAYFARVFDRWRAEGRDGLDAYGDNLGEDRKATVVEALIWRAWHARVLTADADARLAELLTEVEGAAAAPSR